jgi:hypothetical protein
MGVSLAEALILNLNRKSEIHGSEALTFLGIVNFSQIELYS